jgi:tetratricopeptide (TPR) repeat protein
MSRLLLTLLLAFVASSAAAESVIKPLPAADLSALPADAAENLRRQRAEFDEARATLVGPPLAAAYAMIGGIYARNAVFAPAHVAFDNAIALLPEDFRMVYLAGLVAMVAQDLPRAQRHLERALTVQPDYPATRIHLADVMLRQGQGDRARQIYREAIDLNANAATAYARLGQMAMEQRRFDEAREHFAAALANDPEATSLYRQLAAAERARGREAEAAALEARAGQGLLTLYDPLGRALYGAPADPLDAVLALIAEGELEQARSRLRERLQEQPEDPRMLALLARVEAGLGNASGGRELAQRAQRAAPENASVLVAAGTVEEMAGAEDRAAALYTRAIELDPQHAEARLMLGDALMRQRRYAQAADQYRVLASRDGERASGLARLVAAETMAGRCGEALLAAAEARQAHPRDGVRAEIFARVAASCSEASASDRETGAELADAIYQQQPDAQSSEALAMAMAALGRWEDAVDLQRQVLFELAKVNQQAAIERSRTLLERFQNEQAAERPWPEGHPLYQPAAMRPAAR